MRLTIIVAALVITCLVVYDFSIWKKHYRNPYQAKLSGYYNTPTITVETFNVQALCHLIEAIEWKKAGFIIRDKDIYVSDKAYLHAETEEEKAQKILYNATDYTIRKRYKKTLYILTLLTCAALLPIFFIPERKTLISFFILCIIAIGEILTLRYSYQHAWGNNKDKQYIDFQKTEKNILVKYAREYEYLADIYLDMVEDLKEQHDVLVFADSYHYIGKDGTVEVLDRNTYISRYSECCDETIRHLVQAKNLYEDAQNLTVSHQRRENISWWLSLFAIALLTAAVSSAIMLIV